MQLPALGIRLRMLLLGILPAVLILATVLAINAYRMQSLLLSFGEEVLAGRAKTIAAEIDRGSLEAVTTARIMALAAEEGLFGRRQESLAFARRVLDTSPQFYAAYFGYEPDADGRDAAASGNGPEKLPEKALGPGGRFIPYWFRNATEAQGIADNTVTVIIAYLAGLAVLVLLWRVLDGFVRAPVDRPLHRWVIAPQDADFEAEAEAEEPDVESRDREPAA